MFSASAAACASSSARRVNKSPPTSEVVSVETEGSCTTAGGAKSVSFSSLTSILLGASTRRCNKEEAAPLMEPPVNPPATAALRNCERASSAVAVPSTPNSRAV